MSDNSKPAAEHFSSMQSAVALAYQAGSSAPSVVAKGRGLVAKAIIERARQHGVYVHQSQELVALLMQVDLDKDIPPSLYRAVAELLAWLYHIEKLNSGGLDNVKFAPPSTPNTPNTPNSPTNL